MTLQITITDAGRAELIQNSHLGFNAVTIVAVAVGSAQYVPSRTQTALGNEVTRLGSIAGGAVGDGILHVTARDESAAAYNVGEFGLITDQGTLFAVCSLPPEAGWIVQKAAPSIMLLASDVLLDDIDAEQIQFGSVEFMNPPATTEMAGVVELATDAQMAEGTDARRAATPKGVAQETAKKLGKEETAASAWKFPMQDLRSRSDLLGPPSSLHGKGTITGFTSGALLGIPGLSETDYGVAELSGQWSDTSGHAGAAQRVFRTSNGRQFYQHQLPAQNAWSEWYETQNVSKAARSQNRTEVMAVSTGDTVPGLTIYTNIPADFGYMPLLRITGALNSYTSPIEMLVSWYFYEGAVYMPEALVSAAGPMPIIAVGVHNGKIAVQIAFAGGSAYIPRLAIEAVNLAGLNTPDSIYMQGWTHSWSLDPLSGSVPCNLRAVLNHQTVGQYAPTLNGDGATGTWNISVHGSSQWAAEAGYAASAGHTQTADSATWAGTSEKANKLTLHGGDHCTFTWSDDGTSPTYLLGIPGTDPALGRVFATSNLNVKTAVRSGYLNWSAYGGHGIGDGSHLIFDASIGLAPNGSAIGSVDPAYAWSSGHPTLMGWNGGATYGVRVDRARFAEHALSLSQNIVINGTPVNVGSNVTIAAEATNAIGVGQTWKNMGAQRAMGVTYTNTTGRPIMVSVGAASSSGGNALSLTVDGVLMGRSTSPIAGSPSGACAIVPNGSTYRADGGYIESWSELS